MTEKTYCQQLNILRSRSMVIGKSSQSSRIMRILEYENYYNVINGYKHLFLFQKQLHALRSMRCPIKLDQTTASMLMALRI